MNRFKFYFASILSLLLITSCGGDDDDDPRPPVVVSVNLVSSSVTEGGVVSPDIREVTFTFDCDVTASASGSATLNNQPVMFRVDAASPRILVVEVDLTPSTSYSLAVSGGTVTNATGGRNQAIVMRFSTSASEPVTPPVQDNTDIAPALINGSATPSAVKVYTMLRDNYGKKIFSGCMGEVAWGTAYSDVVAASAGKQPAIVGFDYIHLPFSPANWIDYSDITPVRKVWEAGSIPAVTWHWNVADGKGGYATSTDVPFSPSKILVDGTPEHQTAVADVAEMAASLKLLQDAGIPVLFRPFHEANGDFKWGAWFWWGKEGPEVVKQLWAWLYDRLTSDHGLNNLIWVWTVDYSYEGKLAQMSYLRDAYPGNDKVDMIGADIYEDGSLWSRTDIFNALTLLADGKKMVALSECGNLPDPARAKADGALWSYFMSWYEWGDNGAAFGQTWNKKGEWKKVLADPIVLNRGDFNL